jgi:hypothetical protein
MTTEQVSETLIFNSTLMQLITQGYFNALIVNAELHTNGYKIM